MYFIIASLVYSLIASQVECVHILLVSNCISHSHSLWYNKLATLLANSGHQVVLLDTDPLRTKAKNVTHFQIEGVYDFQEMNFSAAAMEAMFEQTSESELANIDTYFAFSRSCRKFIYSNGVANLMKAYKKNDFDLIILDYFCDSFYGLVPYFGSPPFIIATAFADPEIVLDKVGQYDNPSYVPTRTFSSFSPEMNFIERATNTFYNLYRIYFYATSYMPFEEESAKHIFGPDSPSISEIGRNVSLVMVNTHYAISGAKPLLPAVIPVFGFHIDPVKPLPNDIKTFMDGAKHGVILFSFGSNIPSEMISPAKMKIYTDTFSSLPQRVIWKFNSSLLDKKPSNVLISNWIPQSDILAHPKTVAFITHGGLLGSQEAMYYGVPMIGVPLFIDQIANVDRLVQRGLGVRLNLKSTTVETLTSAIQQVTQNPSYSKNMKILSNYLRDMPMSPKETVLYWIEFVLRNKDQMSYLRSQSLQLPFYKLFLLDVIFTFIAIIITICIVPILIVKCLCNLLCRRKYKRKEKKH